eukprot:TRINITY_DN8846_c0_g1_i15.p1 TRINITY_DN8846_c0_g1~~TRINITY_DN8846_c0_g1_i15.p1  ORF type:complete len:761 (-),score=183.82 TRINITY_DN8846_c0_g1_i15:95-2296(-)
MSGQAPLSYYNTIATHSGGRSRSLDLSASKMETLAALIDSLVEIIGVDTPDPSDLPVTVHHQAITRSQSWSSEGQFFIDKMLGRDTVFGIFVEDDEDHQIKSVKFTDEEGSVFGPYTKMSSIRDGINFKTINFPLGEKTPFDEGVVSGRSWRYHISWYKDPAQMQSIVRVRSKQRDSSPANNLEIISWTNYDSSSLSISPSSSPLTLYTQVTMGGRGVVQAGVSLSLQIIYPNGTRSLPTEGFPLQMTDDGFGDVDLVSGDGIYSRHLTIYPSPGRYIFTITVTDNNNTAYVHTVGGAMDTHPQDLPVTVCCGSSIEIPLSQRKATGRFIRTLAGPVVDIVSIEMDRDIFPPATIGDLGVTYNSDEQELIASWTAPGGDYNDGEVSGYHLVYSASIDSLLQPVSEDRELIVISRRDRAGVRVAHAFQYQGVQGDVYVGIRAEDDSGNLGRISNLVSVNIPSKDVNTLTNIEQTLNMSETNWVVIGSVLGIFLVTTLSLLALLFCWLYRRRTHSKHSSLHGFNTKSSGVNVHIPSPAHSVSTDGSSCRSESKLSSHLLVPPMSHPPPSSTSFAANITPTYWSASQLLADHEHRTGVSDTNHSNHDHPHYYVTDPEYEHHVHPSDHLYDQYYPVHHHHRNTNHYHNHVVNDEQFGDYGSDLVDEVLEVNTSNCKSDLNISSETSSTLPMIGISDRVSGGDSQVTGIGGGDSQVTDIRGGDSEAQAREIQRNVTQV